ncbi:MAG: hypothetical protein ACREU6_16325, partial [Steroidobacteraceae bacterium]
MNDVIKLNGCERMRELYFCMSLMIAASVAVLIAVPANAASYSRAVSVDHGAQDPSVSPEGSQIAVSILGKLWLVPVRGGAGRQITYGFGWDTHPAWSPDGRFLAYSHHLQGATDLAVLNLPTGNTDLITRAGGLIGPIEYAPDGSELFFILRGREGDAHIEKVSPAGGKAEPITETQGWHEWSFALSPDGTELLTASGRYGGTNLYHLVFAGRKVTRLTHSLANQGQVVWTRDGKYLYIETRNGVETVFAQSTAGGERQEVYRSPYRDTQIALEPGGQTAVLCAARRLYRLNLATGKVTSIPFRARFELPKQSQADLVITHARVVTGTSAPIVEDATIEIHDGRFRAIHSGDRFVARADVAVIDAAGKTVLPGLMDNHYHYVDPFLGTALLSRGITSIRDPGGRISESMSYKESIHLGLLNGPDIYAAGPLIDGTGDYHPWVAVEIADPAKAAALVDSLKEQGVDLLKVYFLLEPDVLCAVIKEAHRQGLKVTGHLGVRTSWSQAMACGIDGLNHVRVWADLLPLAEQPQGENETLDAEVHPIARMQADWSKIDPQGPAAGALIAKMAQAGVGFDPTLSIQTIADAKRKELSLEEFALAREAYARMGAFVARAERAGVLLLAGTDNGSLFDELE